MIICKFPSTWRQISRKLLNDLHKGWNFLFSLKRISNEDVGRKLSFFNLWPQLVAGWELICLDYHTYAFKDLQYGTWRFSWRRQSGTYLKLYFSYVNTHYHSPYHSLVKGKQTWTKIILIQCIAIFVFFFLLVMQIKQCFKSNELTSISFVFRWT